MDRRNIFIIVAAVVLGLFAVFLADAYFSGREQQQERIAERQKLVLIAVATQDLEFGSVLTPETVRMVSWPASSVPPDAFTNLRPFSGQDVAIRPIAKGEPVLRSRISDRAVLSKNIPANMRAVTVPVNDVTGVAGFVTPGDAVDIMLTRTMPGENTANTDKMTTTVLENVQVLAIDRRSSEKSIEPQSLKMATVLVDPHGAQKLILASEIGRLSLVLRNVEDQIMGVSKSVTTAALGGRSYTRRSSVVLPGGDARAPAQPPAQIARRTVSSPSITPQPPVYSLPTMTIYRGTHGQRQEVQHGIN